MSRVPGGTDYPLEAEVLSEIHLANSFIIDDLLGLPEGEDRTLVDDVGVVADAERLAHVVVGDQDPDAALLEVADDLLDVEHRDRIHARERLIQQYESPARGERARDLHAAPLPARERQR